MKIMVAIVVAILLLMLTVAAGAKPGNPEDRSNPDLVREYIAMPCNGLDSVYSKLYDEMVHLTAHYKVCMESAVTPTDYIMCYYRKLQWDLIDEHAASIEKAWNLMCNDWGERKHPEYEIDF